MKLSLGKAAKEVGRSKTAIANAIKSGRLSAVRKETGQYEIDPAELFRVYPPSKVNSKDGVEIDGTGPSNSPGKEASILTEKVDGLEKLLQEKNDRISELQKNLDNQTKLAEKITLLLENNTSSGNEWEKSVKALEQRIANQEKAAGEREEKEKRLMKQNRALKEQLDEEKSKTFFQKLLS